ncbi:Peptidyl-prolyl cis-trans isomerase D [Venturia nashicola]|nr:Peptidyl-prolyl cis-trans isomerase D [Venturia nashicola]
MASESPASAALAALKGKTDIPHNPFQSLRSGYNLAIYMVKDILGLDPVIVVNLSILFAAISTSGRYVTNYFYYYLKQIFVSSVRIHEDDHLYRYILKWMTDKHLNNKAFRSVKAQTIQKTTIEEEEEAFKAMDQGPFDFKTTGQLFSYRTMIGRNPIRFQPYEMSHMFIHKRNVFLFKHGLRATPQSSRTTAMKYSGELTLECLGRSLDPIKSLLEESQTYYLEETMSSTTIFRANGPHWARTTSRPSRDIETVILEKQKKEELLQDINEYLHPRTRRWYANHGIPYRRGYLFSGPPGTGKTSLTAALAGVFGLDIYVLSLLDPFCNEDALIRLFSSVPSRCIVLLEDIDAAGLKRADDPRLKKKLKVDEEEIEDKSSSLAKPVAISLSGLLNSIDGVSSSEGRILIMTTNKPKDLDQALTRPGRVDMHVSFSLPQPAEMIELFISMYRQTETIDGNKIDDLEIKPTSQSTTPMPQDTVSTDEKEKTPLTEADLKVLAEKFSAELPVGRMSLAAIQGYLLRFKHDPRYAVENASSWAESTLREMEEMQESQS